METVFYPVIFHPEETGYSVSVPDLEGCFTQGDTLQETLEMIQDAIGLYLEGEQNIPAPSAPDCIGVSGKDFVMVVGYDPLAYRKRHNNKSVKKTLSIPAWLNDEAEKAHLNFSSILQEGLKARLNLNI